MSTNTVKHCYLISYIHSGGASHCEVQRDTLWYPYTTSSIVEDIKKTFNRTSDVVITNVFYQGCFLVSDLERFKQEAEKR